MELWVIQMVWVIAQNAKEPIVMTVKNLCPIPRPMILMSVVTLVKLTVNGKKEFIPEFIEIMTLFKPWEIGRDFPKLLILSHLDFLLNVGKRVILIKSF